MKKQRERTLKEIISRRGKEDLVFFIENIINNPEDPQYLKLAPFHHQIVKDLKEFEENEEEFYMLLSFRGSFKTTLVQAFAIQQILKNPDIKIFISSEREDTSKSILRQIKEHFERNSRLRYYYGNYVPEGAETKWSESEIVVSKRTRIQKEPTLRVGSVEQSPVSLHCNLLILDDLVSRANSETKEGNRRVNQYFRDLLSIRDKGSKVIIIGTKWVERDLYSTLISELSAEKGDKINDEIATEAVIDKYL